MARLAPFPESTSTDCHETKTQMRSSHPQYKKGRALCGDC
jgi:hypothetical protein